MSSLESYDSANTLLNILSYLSLLVLAIIAYLLYSVINDWTKFRLGRTIEDKSKPSWVLPSKIIILIYSTTFVYNICNSIVIFTNQLLGFKLIPYPINKNNLPCESYFLKSIGFIVSVFALIELVRYMCYRHYKNLYNDEIILEGGPHALYVDEGFVYNGNLIDIVNIDGDNYITLPLGMSTYTRLRGKGPNYKIVDVNLTKNPMGLDVYTFIKLTPIRSPRYSLL